MPAVFLTGGGMPVIEPIDARILAPCFDSGVYSWNALISITLAAPGGSAGGRTADPDPSTGLLYGPDASRAASRQQRQQLKSR